MPKDCKTESDLARVLDDLEDYTLNAQNYQTLQNTLDSVDHIRARTAEKLLSLCIQYMKEDLKYAAQAIKIVSTILNKIKDQQLSNFVPSALAILNVLKIGAQYKMLQALKTLCFETVISYPEDTLTFLCENHSDKIFEIIDLYYYETQPVEIQVQLFNIVQKLIKILPPDKRATFVKDGFTVWFTGIIPVVVQTLTKKVEHTSDIVVNLLKTLECLTDEVVKCDYEFHKDWLPLLENIYTPKRYPALVSSLLEQGRDYWHRIWIVFIKLLKDQITKCSNSSVSPINVLLPCVENAFKMDINNRCRAFKCWESLIENFSKETDEAFINKRIKLLMVPLTANNAKAEETALAKCNAWWYLIFSFQDKIDYIVEKVVVPYITFCFGKPTTNTAPGLISQPTKVQCVKAFINIIGHNQCEGCVSLPKFNKKIFNTLTLVNHSKDWIHSISSAIRICVEQDGAFTEKQIKCVWKSFILTILDLPDNQIRHDIFCSALIMLDGLTQDCDHQLMSVIVNVLLPVLFSENKIQQMLTSKDEENHPVYKIIILLNKLPVDSLVDRKTAIESIKSITNWLVNDASRKSNNKIEWFLKTLKSNSMLQWTALAESISFCLYSQCPHLLTKMFLWPFKFMKSFVKKEESTTAWLNLYNAISPSLQVESIHDDIFKVLVTHSGNIPTCVFVLNATIAVLEQKLRKKDTGVYAEIEFIHQLTHQLTHQINETQIKIILPSLAGLIVHILTTLSKNTNITIAEHVIVIINNILKMYHLLFKQDNGSDLVKYITTIFASLESTLNLSPYSKLQSLLEEQLIMCAPYFKTEKTLTNHILAIYYKNLHDRIPGDIVQAYEIIEESNTLNQTQKPKVYLEKFTTPSGTVAKKLKKQANIINTVVENGEKFVVVKSNWKFNPKKLTDNQKEKFQRKREDIPALYQDLSQSQDEFKLTTWKTDSQDTSTTSSKPTNTLENEDISVILKNIPNSNFFPKIKETFIMKPAEDLIAKHNEKNLNVNINKSDNNKTGNVVNTYNDDKSGITFPNLIEKSNLGHECNDVSSSYTENVTTPLITEAQSSNIIITNSAPSQIQSERPPRMKRKPKKFDDLRLISVTKRRRLSTVDNSQIEVPVTKHKIETASKIDEIDDENAKKMNNQKFIDNCNEKSSVIGVIPDLLLRYTSKRDESNVLGDKVSASSDFFNAIKSFSQQMLPENKMNKNIDEISSPPDINNPDRNVHDKIQENIGGQLYINSNFNNPSSTLTTNTNEEKVKIKSFTDTKQVIFAPKENAKENINLKVMPDETKGNSVNTHMVKLIKETVKEKLCRNNIKNDTVPVLSNKKKENLDENRCTDHNTTNTMSTPKADTEIENQIPSSKKSFKTKSRIEKQLAIDMVEGHPFLKMKSEKRLSRKVNINSPRKRICLSFNSHDNALKRKGAPIPEKKIKDKSIHSSINNILNTGDISASQDFIESSQDSTVTTIPVQSTKPPGIKLPTIVLVPCDDILKRGGKDVPTNIDLRDMEGNSDIELPCNKTNSGNLTDYMDTEEQNCTYTVVVSSDDENLLTDVSPAAVPSDEYTADADTQPIDPDMFLNKPFDTDQNSQFMYISDTNTINDKGAEIIVENNDTNASLMATSEDITKTLSDSVLREAEKEESSLSCSSDQRTKEFFDNILLISPIKSMSPARDQKSPSPETSSDFVVIKLASPVQSNGEPFQICESPEIFTEDKSSPDKRDQSPPREEVSVTNTSPSSSLSLKRNRPQMRPGGRAAQMLDLCVPDRLQISLNASEKPSVKRSPSYSTSARRNLRIASGENNDNSDDTEGDENFLKLKRNCPTSDCSPSGPILKRKFIDNTDESTASPASKRKRVSFQDPPVSTTMCVEKYLESSDKSSQNSATKRLKRKAHAQTAIKSPRKLENLFKLDSILTKPVESFIEANETQNLREDTELSSLDETPTVEVIKNSDLNDTDPICERLVNCADCIENIAAELSSPAMKELLVKKFKGKVETIGDLAKMTELEINRLCIKAPKVQVAKKVLYEYLSKVGQASEQMTLTIEAAMSESTVLEAKSNVQVQTESTLVESIVTQTECVAVSLASSQTDSVITSNNFAQTNESGRNSTASIIRGCLSERPDFIEKLCECMDEPSKQKIIENSSLDTLIRITMDKISNGDGIHVSSILQDHLAARLECKDLILLFSILFKKVYDKSA